MALTPFDRAEECLPLRRCAIFKCNILSDARRMGMPIMTGCTMKDLEYLRNIIDGERTTRITESVPGGLMVWHASDLYLTATLLKKIF